VRPHRWRSRALWVQGIYYLLTGLWPIFHIHSFEAITGPKADDWLVRMVGLLAAVIGSTLILAVQRETQQLEITVLAAGSALAFAAVDTWYGLAGRIAPVYLADAVLEIGFLALLAGTGRMSSPGSDE
jgi:hypothetical protein